MADPKVTRALNQPSLCLLDLLLIDLLTRQFADRTIPQIASVHKAPLKKQQQQKRNFSSSPHLKLFSYNEFYILLVIWGSIRSMSNLNEERIKQIIQNIQNRAEIAFLCDCKDHIYR